MIDGYDLGMERKACFCMSCEEFSVREDIGATLAEWHKYLADGMYAGQSIENLQNDKKGRAIASSLKLLREMNRRDRCLKCWSTEVVDVGNLTPPDKRTGCAGEAHPTEFFHPAAVEWFIHSGPVRAITCPSR